MWSVSQYTKVDEATLLTLSIFVPIFVINKFLKFKQLAILTGDSITHILFHNLRKKGLRVNICGVVGGEKLNLPSVLYRFSSLMLPYFEYRKNANFILYTNLILLTAIEAYIFCETLVSRGLIEAILALLCVGLIPSVSLLSWSEKGSYSKFSERLPALISNGVFIYYSFKMTVGSPDLSIVLIGSLSLIFSLYLGKFSRQVVIFWLLILLIFSFSIFLLVPLIVCSLLIMCDSNLRSEIVAQLIYLKNYKSYQSQNFEVGEAALKKLLHYSWFSDSRLFRIYIRLFLHSGVGILIMLPTAYLLLIENDPELTPIFFAAISMALITTTHLLYFIGSGDRYMYHVITIPAFFSVKNSGISMPLIWLNGAIIFICLMFNLRNMYSHSKSVKNKCDAYAYLYSYIGENKTVFFDHYKDGEIFQLVNNLYTEKFKTSTSRSYLWNEISKSIFSNYPKISFDVETLKLFSVDFLITADSLYRSDLELACEFKGYRLYRVINMQIN